MGVPPSRSTLRLPCSSAALRSGCRAPTVHYCGTDREARELAHARRTTTTTPSSGGGERLLKLQLQCDVSFVARPPKASQFNPTCVDGRLASSPGRAPSLAAFASRLVNGNLGLAGWDELPLWVQFCCRTRVAPPPVARRPSALHHANQRRRTHCRRETYHLRASGPPGYQWRGRVPLSNVTAWRNPGMPFWSSVHEGLCAQRWLRCS